MFVFPLCLPANLPHLSCRSTPGRFYSPDGWCTRRLSSGLSSARQRSLLAWYFHAISLSRVELRVKNALCYKIVAVVSKPRDRLCRRSVGRSETLDNEAAVQTLPSN